MRRGVAAEDFSSETSAALRDLFSNGLGLPPEVLAGAFPLGALAGAFPFAFGFIGRFGVFSFLPQAMWRFFLSDELDLDGFDAERFRQGYLRYPCNRVNR